MCIRDRAASLLKIGRTKGVSRPTIAIPFPSRQGHPTTMVDAGANADCSPEWLLQFAQLGASYKRHRWGIGQPRVGILTIGEEAGKGNKLVKEACELFAEFDWQKANIEFVGNIEGGDIFEGACDVFVADGFTGNVVLKALEGTYEMFKREIGQAVAEAPEAKAKTDEIFEFYDPVSIGTGMLLGVKQVSMIAHGASQPRALASAIKTASELAEMEMPELLKADLAG